MSICTLRLCARTLQSAMLAAVVLGASGCATSGAPTVTAGGERLAGTRGSNGVAVFRGIPYAAPPIGDLRWKAPVPPTPRSGLQQATTPTPACVQSLVSSTFYRGIARTLGQDPMLIPDLERVSEDCLYLNVWTPALGSRKPLPVMVWIHGGANAAGVPIALQTEGTNLARKGVVVVSFSYRLGVFGFLAHPDLTAESEHHASGNYALLDQIAALRWVKQNIAAFGGDASKVTIFGESAGATNVTYLLASPLARGLFQRAAIQSGGYAASDFRTLAEAEALGRTFAEAAVPQAKETPLAALRAMPAEDVYKAWTAIKRPGTNAPNVDGWVLPEPAGRMFDKAQHNRVPLIVGFNREEWSSLRGYWPNVTRDAFHQVLRTVYGSLADRAIALYPTENDAQAVEASDRWQTDWYFACPSRFLAQRMSRAGDPVFFYVFTRAVQAPGGEKLGAYHAAEIPYVWDTLSSEPWVPRQAWDHELAEKMSAAWIRFAVTGDPNGGSLPEWPVFGAEAEHYLDFGDTIQAASGIRREACTVYEELLAPRIAGVR